MTEFLSFQNPSLFWSSHRKAVSFPPLHYQPSLWLAQFVISPTRAAVLQILLQICIIFQTVDVFIHQFGFPPQPPWKSKLSIKTNSLHSRKSPNSSLSSNLWFTTAPEWFWNFHTRLEKHQSLGALSEAHPRFKKCLSKTLLSCLFASHKWWENPKGTDLPVVLQEHVAPERWVNEELMNETKFLLVNPHSISTCNCTTQSSRVRSETGNSTLPSWEMTNNLGFEAHFGLLRSHQFEALL